MRVGINPFRDTIIKSENIHRIIIPLFIPNEFGYYADSYKIFRLTIDSLHSNSIYEFKISVSSNGCSDEINSRLSELLLEGRIDELIINKNSIGKLNSIYKAIQCSSEKFLTITDADVLFVKGWDHEVFNIFNTYNNSSVISPTPIPGQGFNLTHPIWWDYIFKGSISINEILDIEGLNLFAQSVGWDTFQSKMPILTNNSGYKVVLGCGHFCATYRREVFNKLSNVYSEYHLGGDSEINLIDMPTISFGGYRLSTYSCYAFHLGNKFERWMDVNFRSENYQSTNLLNLENIPKISRFNLLYIFFINRIWIRLIFNKHIKNFLIKRLS